MLGTLILLAGAALLTFLFERDGALAGMATPHAALNALIHSVMLRTAGFNAIYIAALSDAGVLMACFVMIVGGGSVGTAGGVVSVAWGHRCLGPRRWGSRGSSVPGLSPGGARGTR